MSSNITELNKYAEMIRRQAGVNAVRPYRQDGYVNLMNRYGTKKDASEHYQFQREPIVSDAELVSFYEGNGLFAKIIDTPAEEAIKHGFELKDITDDKTVDFYKEALDELNWDENAATAIKWARLFGGSIIVLLVNDGRGIDEPLDWDNIESIDNIRVYDRSLIQPDYTSMFRYDPKDPFKIRGARLGVPEYYDVFSKYGNFRVHESRCLIFQNGILPENTSNSVYQMWGMPEYVRLNKAIRDSEIAHGSAVKLLDKSVQPVYSMKDLAAELATEEGEERVLRRLETIDMARGMLNTITVDSEGESYDFKSFSYTGVSDVVESTCNYLSAISSIPQTILFGRCPEGMNSTGASDLENYYNYVERIQKRMLKSNIRYLLSIIFKAGMATKEVNEIPPIIVEFNPLWSSSETEKASIESQKAAVEKTKADTANVYVQMGAIDAKEVRKKLASDKTFDVETMLDDYTDKELEGNTPQGQPSGGEIDNGEQQSPAAPEATKLPQDMDKNIESEQNNDDDSNEPRKKEGSCGILVVKDGKILVGTRYNTSHYGEICGPGGHIDLGESTDNAAIRETEEEFGITPTEMIRIGTVKQGDDDSKVSVVYLCTEYEGEPSTPDLEMTNIRWMTLEELKNMDNLFKPFADSLILYEDVLKKWNGETV